MLPNCTSAPGVPSSSQCPPDPLGISKEESVLNNFTCSLEFKTGPLSPALGACWEYLGFPHLSGPPWTCVLLQRETPGRRAGRIGRIDASARTGSWRAGRSCLAHSDPSPPPASDLCPWLAAFFPCGLFPFPCPALYPHPSLFLPCLSVSPLFSSPPFLLPPPFLYRIPCFVFGPFPLFMHLFFFISSSSAFCSSVHSHPLHRHT